MNEILHDRQLLDLIEQLHNAFYALDAAVLFDEPADIRHAADAAVCVLGDAADFLTELRYAEHVRRG